MEENFFREFVEWVEEQTSEEFFKSEEYSRIRKEEVKAADLIVKCLGSDKLLDNYYDKCAAAEKEYFYFMCEKVVRAFVKIMADTGVI